MAELAVIYMEADIHMFTFNLLVGDECIIGVDHKVNVHQALDKLPIVE
jgi:hypothetical protein